MSKSARFIFVLGSMRKTLTYMNELLLVTLSVFMVWHKSVSQVGVDTMVPVWRGVY
jgi:hypothetical protein